MAPGVGQWLMLKKVLSIKLAQTKKTRKLEQGDKLDVKMIAC